MTELIEGEVVEQMSQAMELADAAPPVTLFRTDDPEEVVAKATAIATTLGKVLRDQKLTTQIGKREHVRVEGWTLLGTMLGVFPVCEWTRKLTNPEGWEARVVAKTLSGATVGAAEAECLKTEATWSKRDDYALRSMAQTRATSKALRQPLGFVITLAGFDPTPAEEMPREERRLEGPPAPRDAQSWKQLQEGIAEYGPSTWDDWRAFGVQLRDYLFPEDVGGSLSKEQSGQIWQINLKAARLLSRRHSQGEFPPPSRQLLRAIWREAAEMGEELEGPPWRMSPDETDRPDMEAWKSDATGT